MNEGAHGMAKKLLTNIVNGHSKEAEGIKMSKELAEYYLDWLNRSEFGKRNSGLPLFMLVKASFSWGTFTNNVPKELKDEVKALQDYVKKNESAVNDAINNVLNESEVNEGRSINKIQNEWTKVTAEMAAKAKDWKAAEGDAKAKILDELKALTAKKKGLEAELDAAISDKDKDLELVVTEAVEVSEAVEINEEDIKSDDQFTEYATKVLKDAFGDEFDEAKAKEVIDGILSKSDGDYGSAVGMLQSSLG